MQSTGAGFLRRVTALRESERHRLRNLDKVYRPNASIDNRHRGERSYIPVRARLSLKHIRLGPDRSEKSPAIEPTTKVAFG